VVKGEQLKIQEANAVKFDDLLGVITKRITADQLSDKISTAEQKLDTQLSKMIEREIKKCESKLGDLQNFQATTKSSLTYKLE
jgi:hypothetical protein